MFSFSKGLSVAQQAEVQRGLAAGLSRDQVSVYADPLFEPDQMEEIRQAFLSGLSAAEVRTLADPLISAAEMRRIRGICQTAVDIEANLQSLDKMIQRSEQLQKSQCQLFNKYRNRQRRSADHERV